MLKRFWAWLRARFAKPVPPAVEFLPMPDLDAVSEAEADAPLPPVIVEALKIWRDRSTAPATEFPDTPSNERYVVWTRGTVDTMTNDGKIAGKAWARVIQRAGTHRFWDRTHHAGVPSGLRQELVVPLEEMQHGLGRSDQGHA